MSLSLQSVASTAMLGNVYLWQFNCAGIRDLDYAPTHLRIVLLSGPPSTGDSFKLWTWNGNGASQPRQVQDLANYESISQILVVGVAPEGIRSDNDHIWIVFDEGKRKVAGAECKSLPSADQQKTLSIPSPSFNAFTVRLLHINNCFIKGKRLNLPSATSNRLLYSLVMNLN